MLVKTPTASSAHTYRNANSRINASGQRLRIGNFLDTATYAKQVKEIKSPITKKSVADQLTSSLNCMATKGTASNTSVMTTILKKMAPLLARSDAVSTTCS